ncbi:MAG: FAD-binding protein [Sulfolobales archaeon]
MKCYTPDVVIVGGGISGLSTMFFLDRKSGPGELSIAVISKSSLGYGTSTYYSAGAFRCPVGGYSREDYIKDVLESGRYVNRKALVELVANEAFNSITALEELSLKFKVSRGTLRVVSDDPLFPGKELVMVLRKYAFSRKNTIILENTHVLDVVRGSDSSFYTVGITHDGKRVIINSKVVCLATGGVSNIFIRSDNPQQLTCDGHGISLRLGLPLVDMEFTQFFPLGIAEDSKPSFMIPFSRGKLVNRLGEDIVLKYGLESLGKAIIYYRDALSRSIMTEVALGNDVDGALLLYPDDVQDDLSSFAHELMKKLKLGVPIKVLPTAHFSMGGVEVDDEVNTSIKGLYVAGELVGGIHGANRLGGNALTSCVVTSNKVAENILKHINNEFHERLKSDSNESLNEVFKRYSLRGGSLRSDDLKSKIRHIMWSNVGVLRSDESIKEALNILNEVHENLDDVVIDNHIDVVKYSELENLLLASMSVSYSALLRTESRGSHIRTDYPQEDSKWRRNIKIRYYDNRFIYRVD